MHYLCKIYSAAALSSNNISTALMYHPGKFFSSRNVQTSKSVIVSLAHSKRPLVRLVWENGPESHITAALNVKN
jgi:hypothetical protein